LRKVRFGTKSHGRESSVGLWRAGRLKRSCVQL
jgi:hypothetical protein